MTNVERILDRFVRSCDAEMVNLSADRAKIIWRGKLVDVSVNIYGDIINLETGKIMAESNLSHDVVTIGYAYPTTWKIRG